MTAIIHTGRGFALEHGVQHARTNPQLMLPNTIRNGARYATSALNKAPGFDTDENKAEAAKALASCLHELLLVLPSPFAVVCVDDIATGMMVPHHVDWVRFRIGVLAPSGDAFTDIYTPYDHRSFWIDAVMVVDPGRLSWTFKGFEVCLRPNEWNVAALGAFLLRMPGTDAPLLDIRHEILSVLFSSPGMSDDRRQWRPDALSRLLTSLMAL